MSIYNSTYCRCHGKTINLIRMCQTRSSNTEPFSTVTLNENTNWACVITNIHVCTSRHTHTSSKPATYLFWRKGSRLYNCSQTTEKFRMKMVLNMVTTSCTSKQERTKMLGGIACSPWTPWSGRWGRTAMTRSATELGRLRGRPRRCRRFLAPRNACVREETQSSKEDLQRSLEVLGAAGNCGDWRRPSG
jgi:hypothetical protein